MANNVITGVDFLTNEICNLFGIKTDNTCEIHRKLWYMFYSIQNRPTLKGYADEDFCMKIDVLFKNSNNKPSVISFLSKKILTILRKHLKKKKINRTKARKLVRKKLNKHKEIQLGDFM